VTEWQWQAMLDEWKLRVHRETGVLEGQRKGLMPIPESNVIGIIVINIDPVIHLGPLAHPLVRG